VQAVETVIEAIPALARPLTMGRSSNLESYQVTAVTDRRGPKSYTMISGGRHLSGIPPLRVTGSGAAAECHRGHVSSLEPPQARAVDSGQRKDCLRSHSGQVVPESVNISGSRFADSNVIDKKAD
jgi:hypothetical protein